MTGGFTSVVIPTYNRAHLVVDALESAIAQSWRPLEIVVVDDGSEDDTIDVISSWHSLHGGIAPKISLRIFRQENSGGNVARNRGVREARGEFFAFLDSDDIWWPQKLKKQMAVMSAHPECGAVYCGVREVDIETSEIEYAARRAFPQGKLLDRLLVRDVTAPTSTYLVRRDVFESSGGFDESLQARQDWDMWIRIAERTEIRAVPEVLVDFRRHSGPRTVSDPTRELVAHKAIMNKYSKLRRSRGVAVRLAALGAYHRRAGRVNFHHVKAPGRALWHYVLAIIVWPFAADSYAALIGWFLPSGLRRVLRAGWNRIFGKTVLAIGSH